jgi:hypothetical protein
MRENQILSRKIDSATLQAMDNQRSVQSTLLELTTKYEANAFLALPNACRRSECVLSQL